MNKPVNFRCFSAGNSVQRRVFLFRVIILLFSFYLKSGISQDADYVYFVPLPEQQIHAVFRVLYTSTGSTYHAVVSIVPSATSTPGDRHPVFYDHWEDGYELNISSPVQASTWIFGDGNPSNNGPYPDEVTSGEPLVLQNNLTVPSNPSIIKADGGDKIASSKSLSCARSSWALNPGTVLADAVEFMNTKSFSTSFVMPIGQNTASNGMFNHVSLHVQASQNATQIQIDKDGNGTTDITATINQGESYQVNGGIMQSATVNSSNPVQVVLVTGLPGANYESRWYNIYPLSLWNSGYWTPVATTLSLGQSHVFLYNPTSSNLVVNIHTNANISGSPVNIPPKGIYRYIMPMGTSAYFDNPGTNFYAIGAMDADASNNSTWDWGYSLVPEEYLTNSFFVGWGPGAYNDLTKNGNPVWVGAAYMYGNSVIYVDLDGNPATGPLTDINGNKYDYTMTIPALGSVRIYDPDNDQTGVHVYTVDGTQIVGAWGEDPSKAEAGNPFLDVGTTVAPDPVIRLRKSAELIWDNNGNGLTDPGDSIRWTIRIYNQTLQTYASVNLKDTLDSRLAYVPLSTMFNNLPVSDNGSPFSPFPLDETGFEINALTTGAKDSVSFLSVCVSILGGGPSIPNRVTATNNFGESSTAESMIMVNYPGITPCTAAFTNGNNGPAVSSYNINATLFMKVTDADHNLNGQVTDQVQVLVSNPGTSDAETRYLTETGPSTGIFTGSVTSSTSLGVGAGNGILYAVAGNTVQFTYTDQLFGGTCQSSATMAVSTLAKQLYLSDPAATGDSLLDRTDPANSGDQTLSTSPALNNSGGTETITAVATTTGSTSSGSVLTFQHTPGNGSNRLLVVGVTVGGNTYSNNGAAINSVTFNNQAMTLAGSQIVRGSARTAIYYMVNPPQAMANVVVTLAFSSSIGAGATTFTGVNQASPIGTFYSNNAANGVNAFIQNIISIPEELVYSVACFDEGTVNQGIITATGQTQLWNHSGLNFISGAASTKPGAASTSVSYAQIDPTTQEWVIAALPIKPASAGYGNFSVAYTQSPSMCSPFTIAGGGFIRAKFWLTAINGAMPANPAITCALRSGTSPILTLNNPIFSENSGTSNDTLVFTGSIPAPVTIPAGTPVKAVITSSQPGVSFRINYDHLEAPSVITLPTTTVIEMGPLEMYNEPYPGGSVITGGTNGQSVYVRTTVSDPFGNYDIDPGTTASLQITSPSGGTVMVAMTQVAVTSCGKVYEYSWSTPSLQGIYTLTATSREGYENTISASKSNTFTLSFTDTGTPCDIWFANGENGTTTTSYTGSTSYQICVKVSDMDRNISSARQSIQVSVQSSSGSGDTEVLTLLETESPAGSGIYNTGIFTGCLPGSTTSGTGNSNGTLYAQEGANLTATFNDLVNAPDICTANALILSPGVTAASVTNTLLTPSDGIAVTGDSVIWKIVVSNPGNTPLTNVELTDLWIPGCLNYVGASPPPSGLTPDGTLTWNTTAVGGSIPSGNVRIIFVRFTALTPCTLVTNSASVSGTASAGPAVSSLTITNPQVTVTKTKLTPVAPPAIYTGNNIVYRIKIVNTGSTMVESMPLTDYYSASNLEFLTATPSPSFSGGGQVEWADLLPEATRLPVGDSLLITVSFAAISGNYPFTVSNNATTGFAALDINAKPVPSVTAGVDVLVLNKPVANPDEFQVTGNMPGDSSVLRGQVLFNDISPDGLLLTVSAIPLVGPAHAAEFSLNADGSFYYKPTDGYTGTDSFIYQVCDSNNYCVSAQVTVHVLPCINPPARTGNINQN